MVIGHHFDLSAAGRSRIAAIIFAAKVNGQVAAGDIAGAQDSSKKAKMFSFIAIGIGVAVLVDLRHHRAGPGVGLAHDERRSLNPGANSHPSNDRVGPGV